MFLKKAFEVWISCGLYDIICRVVIRTHSRLVATVYKLVSSCEFCMEFFLAQCL